MIKFILVQPRRHFNWWTSSLIVLSGKQYKVVCSSTLELFVSNRFVMLDIVFTNSRIIFANNLIVETFCNFGSHRSMSVFWCFDLARIWKFICSCTRYSIIIFVKSVTVYAERLVVTSRFNGGTIFDYVCDVVLRSRIKNLMRVNAYIISLWTQEIRLQLRQILLMSFRLLILRHVLTWS